MEKSHTRLCKGSSTRLYCSEVLGPEMSTEVDILPDLQQNGTLLVPFNSEGGENDAALASHPSVLGMVLKGSKYKGLAVPVRLPRQWRK